MHCGCPNLTVTIFFIIHPITNVKSQSDDVLKEPSVGNESLLVDSHMRSTCQLNNCQNDGECFLSDLGGQRCICPQNYGGEHCETAHDGCASRPCMNDAGCSNVGNGKYL